jgi:hypothetical protein
MHCYGCSSYDESLDTLKELALLCLCSSSNRLPDMNIKSIVLVRRKTDTKDPKTTALATCRSHARACPEVIRDVMWEAAEKR